MLGYVLLLITVLAVASYFFGRKRAAAVVGGRQQELHSRPSYHGAYVAAWVGLPSAFLVLIWLLLQGPVIDNLLLWSLPPGTVDGLTSGQISLLLSEIKSVAAGNVFSEPSLAVQDAAARYHSWQIIARWAMAAVALSIALLGLFFASRRISPEFRARHGAEHILSGLMIACSLIAILTTLGIVLSLLIEALRFFDRIPALEFFFGLNWEPQIPIREGQVTGGGAFGAIPVFTGTLLIALIAMAVATPIGLYSAIYLTEYAHPKVRAVIKPVLELLAGIPTVVYGFFAVLTVAPAMRQFGDMIGVPIAPNSALAAGGVMGIMIIPFISSLSDDAIAAVPRAMRDGSYAMGATKGETITKVLLPAALPGIMGGILLAVSRAIGETMIVVMAAGIIASLTANPLEPVTTVTVQIVTLLIGDTEFDNPKTLAAFALGLVLFLVTLALNVLALHIVRKYREQYE
ncbi:phosphate ABC transporter permease [Methyloceanibacter superfactus]|jgi:phosphate transport system permease protein|uniref:Phosphate transport system permease protein n=1 Tax=Methyloceanibacter superfactus TaxID=1774969 RepID=A0A1E3W3R9_9HYPH|nr:phosphate ABC transporter permease subunit PstC [Methyloceanibacter superfactus]ODS00455.1 phosphate ABC transporter permease [Methyloceanibacter superfactus]